LADKLARSIARAEKMIEKPLTIDPKNIDRELATFTKAVA